MLEWQARQKHDEDRMRARRETGEVNEMKVTTVFNGQKFWAHFEANGHDHSEFAKCKCKEAIDG